VEELADSIRRLGLLHPIIITREGVLVAGGCRIAAYRFLAAADPSSPKWKLIMAQYADELAPDQLRIIELEENIKRTDLTWQEEACAVYDYYLVRGADYTLAQTAKDLGLKQNYVQTCVTAAQEIRKGDDQVAKCETLGAAYNLLRRRFSRAVDSEVNILIETEEVPLAIDLSHVGIGAEPSTAQQSRAQVEQSRAQVELRPNLPTQTHSLLPVEADWMVTCGDFFSLAYTYDGPTFNFIHTDFPYGINHDKSDQGAGAVRGTYADTPDIFWRCLDVLLDNQDRLLAPSCHLMVWLSMLNYHKTKDIFERAGFFVNPVPLIWYKSDKIGILPDHNRRPRQVYETCLLITRGDRMLVKALPNVSDAPARKRQAEHVSEKPTLALLPFFRMLVDGSTRMLDPTCGSGSSLSSAAILGASFIRGWEIDKYHAETARSKMHYGRFHTTTEGEYPDDEVQEQESGAEPEAGAGKEDSSDDASGWEDQGPSEEELQAIERGEIGIDDLDL
jgi:hypothetical protein